MIDIDDLFTTIISTVNAAGALSAVHAKTYFDLAFKLPSRPHARVRLTGGTTPMLAYGHDGVDKVPITFSVFSSDLSEANSLAKAFAETFTGSANLVLADGTTVRATRRGSRVIVEGAETRSLVFHASVDVEFWVTS